MWKVDMKKKYNRNNHLAQTDQRVYMIAMDISAHFFRTWKDTGFKGLLAVHSIATAFKYKKFLDEIGEISTEVVVSRTDDRQDNQHIHEDETALKKHERRVKEDFGDHKNYEKEIIAKFESPEEPDILIVVNKLLTGFDVPRNTVLYLDKDIREHTLLQATGRVNRIFDKKEFGYVIDYHGNLKQLLDAVSHYDSLAESAQNMEFDSFDKREIEDSFCEIKKEIDKLPQHYSNLTSLFSSVKNKRDKSSYENTLFEKDKREDFYEKFSAFGNSLHRALSSAEFITQTSRAEIKKYKEELKFFLLLKKHIQQVFVESVSYKDYEPKIKRLLNTYVQAEKIQTVVPLINIYDNNFNQKLTGKSTQSQALMLIHSVKKYIAENIEKDRVFYEKLSDLLQKTLDEYREERISEKAFLQQAKKLKDKALTRTDDEIPSALKDKEEAKAFFGILKKTLWPDEKSPGNSEETITNKLVEMSIIISQMIEQHSIVDWIRNRDIQNRIKNEIEDYLYKQKEETDLCIDFDSIDRIMEETIKTAKSHYSHSSTLAE